MSDWNGCYDDGWAGEITPEAFSHPAKFSRGLIRRIYQHAVDEGWLHPGDTVIDPFGGVALGGLDAMKHGLNWCGVELERPFQDTGQGCDCTGLTKEDWRRYQGRYDRMRYLESRLICPACMTKALVLKGRIIPHSDPHHYAGNIDLWMSRYAPHFPTWGTAQLIQGDSRELAQVIREAGACVSSPPFQNQYASHDNFIAPHDTTKLMDTDWSAYGHTPGNLGNLPATSAGLSAAISSPPYAESMTGQPPTTGKESTDRRVERLRAAGYNPEKLLTPGRRAHGNLGELEHYGSTPGQLGAMPARGFEAAVSSPPYEHSEMGGHGGEGPNSKWRDGKIKSIDEISSRALGIGYGDTPGQLGGETSDDFWSDARTIVEQVYQVLAPGGHAIWVVKAFVKNKARVDFPGQWRQMCEAVGFTTLHEHRAWLVKDKGTQIDLQGNHHHKQTERKSFFRRLAEQKGSPRIDYEIVLCMVKL